MIKTTQIYIIDKDKWLLLLRNKKKNDINHDKWIAVGGKVEPGETVEECAIRETYEETGLVIDHLEHRGIVYFIYDEKEPEEMHIFTTSSFHGDLQECNEGTLKWIEQENLFTLPMWEGDRIYLERLLHGMNKFIYEFHYDKNDNLIAVKELEVPHG